MKVFIYSPFYVINYLVYFTNLKASTFFSLLFADMLLFSVRIILKFLKNVAMTSVFLILATPKSCTYTEKILCTQAPQKKIFVLMQISGATRY